MKPTPRKLAFSFGILAVAAFLVWTHFKTDEFFPNIGVSVAASAIRSHQTPWYLGAEEHSMVLQVPASAWPALLAQFKAKPGFRSINTALKTNYHDFVAGRETFYPRSVSGASAGQFKARGRDGYDYFCRFLRDGQSGQLWFVGWSPDD